MAIKITIPSSGSADRVITNTIPSSGSSNRVIANTTRNSKQVTSAKVEQLANVDVSTGLLDGYTLVYDEPTGKWVAQSIDAATTVESLDGGYY